MYSQQMSNKSARGTSFFQLNPRKEAVRLRYQRVSLILASFVFQFCLLQVCVITETKIKHLIPTSTKDAARYLNEFLFI